MIPLPARVQAYQLYSIIFAILSEYSKKDKRDKKCGVYLQPTQYQKISTTLYNM